MWIAEQLFEATKGLVEPTPGKFAVVSVRRGREFLVKEVDNVEEAQALLFKVLKGTRDVLAAKDHVMILYTGKDGGPERQVILSRRAREAIETADQPGDPLAEGEEAFVTSVMRTGKDGKGHAVKLTSVGSGFKSKFRVRIDGELLDGEFASKKSAMSAADEKLTEAVGGDVESVVRRVLLPAVENLRKYISDGDPKAIRAGFGMALSSMALALDQIGATESAKHVRAANGSLKAGRSKGE